MDTSTGRTSTGVSIKPNTIKVAQEQMGRLDVLVCGQCHAVFHFVEEFQQHHSKEGACSKVSNFRENNNMEQKAQVWAFLLWKDTQNQQESPDKEGNGSWKLYQKWCNMDNHTRDGWILAGKTIQTFTKISNAKMQDVPQSGTTEGGKTVVLRKVIRNGQPDSPDKKDFKSDPKIKFEPIDTKEKFKLKSPVKSKEKIIEDNDNIDGHDDYFVEQIMAKRFNQKRKVFEYLLKWKKRNSPVFSKDNYNTWEDEAHVSIRYKHLMDDFESNLAKQREKQGAKSGRVNQSTIGQKIIKTDNATAGPSTPQGGRPMRLSKSKATDRVKQWCGSMIDDEASSKRKVASSDSDSDETAASGSKRHKVGSSDEEWVSDSMEDKTLIGRSDVIQRAFRGANIQSNGSRPSTGSDLPNNFVANKTIKVESKSTSAQSNLYIMHKKEGIIKLDSSPTNKLSVKGPNQPASSMVIMRNSTPIVRKQVVSGGTHSNSITPVKVLTKSDGTQIVTQMQVVSNKASPTKAGTLTAVKSEPIKIQPRPDPGQVQQIHLVTAIPSPINVQTQRMVTSTTPTARPNATVQRPSDNNAQRPLLPRPTAIGRGTPVTSPVVHASQQPRTPVARQTTTIPQQQRPVVQKRIPQGLTPTTKLVQTPTTGALQAIQKTKIVPIAASQGKALPKPAGTTVSAISSAVSQQTAKLSPKVTLTSGKSQTAATPQQKMMLARKKVAAEAGIVPKPVNRPALRGQTAIRGKPNPMANKPKESKLAATGGLHMEFHVESESSSGEEPDFPPLPAEGAQPCPEPDSPPRQLSLCPHTGRLIGPDGIPIEQPEPEPEPPAPTPMAIVPASAAVASNTATISADGVIASTPSGETTELVLPTLESFSDAAGNIVRVEMSPGGTTGIVVHTSEAPTTSGDGVVMPGPDMPSLDDPSVEIQTTSAGEVVVNVAPIATTEVTSASGTATVTTVAEATTTTMDQSAADARPTSSDVAVLLTQQETTATAAAEATSETNNMEVDASVGPATLKIEENSGIVTLTGEDGVLYQVASQSENGQTVLLAQGADGEQQCVYVTTEHGATGEEGQILSLDHAVAEAVAQLGPNAQFYVKEGTTEETVEASEVANADQQQMLMYNPNPVDDNTDNQVVAQVVSSDPPTEGGIRKVVLLLPDGNLMMTEVDEEQYVALELDK
ncbi:uncharacterized protein LOC106635880 [Copidosoma floridanum]|uniref:uncharacterized protein LOC106635880 n=1 Tax=Copidosoma floridanum TaxID=29053 RepID=UPI0006C9E2E4|nr:uncharacterized protein LOC106635880 [Copidosoma floridanum]XP_014203554.1 uncharacterized protein LOC106635880 [Copidosoma floridanum]XP_014203555.1 uncharacterized protein LOC106635880 [Copidosoma floridanum]